MIKAAFSLQILNGNVVVEITLLFCCGGGGTTQRNCFIVSIKNNVRVPRYLNFQSSSINSVMF